MTQGVGFQQKIKATFQIRRTLLQRSIRNTHAILTKDELKAELQVWNSTEKMILEAYGTAYKTQKQERQQLYGIFVESLKFSIANETTQAKWKKKFEEFVEG